MIEDVRVLHGATRHPHRPDEAGDNGQNRKDERDDRFRVHTIGVRVAALFTEQSVDVQVLASLQTAEDSTEDRMAAPPPTGATAVIRRYTADNSIFIDDD